MTVPAPSTAASTTGKQKNPVRLAALIVGAVALLFAIIPVLSFLAWLPALAAIVLAIIGLVQKNRTRGLAWAGLGLGIVSWIIAIIVSVVSVAGFAGAVNDAIEEASAAPIAPVEEPAASAQPDDAAPSELTEDDASSSGSVGQANAARSAENYLRVTAFSRDGLIKQLEFEQYSTEDATAAVDSLAIDWNEQATKKAKEYLDVTAFSREGLVDQLTFEGFTAEQADQAVSANGL